MEKREGLIKVRLKARHSLQMSASYHKNLVCPSSHCPLALPLSYLFLFLSSPRPTSKESPEDVTSEWIQQLREPVTVSERKGPRNEKYEWQNFWSKSQTLTTPCSVKVTSWWTHCQLTLGAKYNSHFFTHQESLFKQPMPGEDWGIHRSCCSLLPLGYIAIWRLWNKQWGFFLNCP